MKKLYNHLIFWLLFKSSRPRELFWKYYYDVICCLYPLKGWKSNNFGYAVLNKEGVINGI